MIAGAVHLSDFDDAWNEPHRGAQLRAIRHAATQLRRKFAGGPRCVAVRTLPLTTLAYPTRYAFWATAFTPAPFVMLTHRCLLVQFFQRGVLKNMLFNPTDVEGARSTPFFARMIEQLGHRLTDAIAKRFDPLEDQLAAVGIQPADIDYVAFDHFHTQDLRKLLGTTDGAHRARFPNAVLLAPKSEWEDWNDLHPMQRAWFVQDGKAGVDTSKVIFTGGDFALGDGVLLLRTPGHTSGNQTLFLNTSSGVWGISENGTCADNWSPLESRIRGLAFTCKRQDLDVVLNSNTPELGATQYTSMILERTIVDRVRRAPGFVQMFPSSEVTPSLLAPGLSPTVVHREIVHGQVTRPNARSSRPERENAQAAV